MKKIYTLLAVLFLAVGAAQAQTPTFSKGDNDVSLGIGFGWGVPISLSYERGVYDINESMSIGAGATFGWSTKKYATNYRYTRLFFGAKAMFHYFMWENFDLSAGLTLGYQNTSCKYIPTGEKWNSNYYKSGVLFGFTVNAKYYFTENIAAFAEAGYDVAYLKIGATYKF